MTDANFSCRCGKVAGRAVNVDQPLGNHVVCYCTDCRAFARACGGDALDAAGGTELYQTTIGKVTLERGEEHLAAMRLSKRGPVRWYASCCDTALLNTMPSPAVPFASFVRAALSQDPGTDCALGPVRGSVHTGSALGKPIVPALGGLGLLGVLANFARLMLGARRRGEHKRSPLHRDGKPIVEPRMPDAEERERLYA